MSAIVIAGDTSGTVTLQAPAVSGTTTITLPNTSMTVLGGSVGTNTAVVFADSGVANVSSGFTFNKVSNNVTFANSIVYGGVTVANSVTGTGSMVLSTNPTISGNLTTSSLVLANTVISAVTGTGSMVLSASPTLSGTLTLAGTLNAGTNTALASVLSNIVEPTTVSNTAAANTITFDIMTQSVVYYTANSTGNWTMNFRASSNTTLNSALTTGQTVTVAFLATQGATAYYNNLIQIDGANTTAKYQGGTAWSAGNASGIDGYTYSITKTANATYNVLASQTQFK